MKLTWVGCLIIILCVWGLFRITDDFALIKEKRRFQKYIEKEFENALWEKSPKYAKLKSYFTRHIKSHFLEEGRSTVYVTIYLENEGNVGTLIKFFYEEQENAVLERIEITEFEKGKLNTILREYKFFSGVEKYLLNMKMFLQHMTKINQKK